VLPAALAALAALSLAHAFAPQCVCSPAVPGGSRGRSGSGPGVEFGNFVLSGIGGNFVGFARAGRWRAPSEPLSAFLSPGQILVTAAR
jgi:hypothetical protein